MKGQGKRFQIVVDYCPPMGGFAANVYFPRGAVFSAGDFTTGGVTAGAFVYGCWPAGMVIARSDRSLRLRIGTNHRLEAVEGAAQLALPGVEG